MLHREEVSWKTLQPGSIYPVAGHLVSLSIQHSDLSACSTRASDLASQLKELFPPHPSLHNCITQLDGTSKTAPVVWTAATLKEYGVHLAPASRGGVGALGMYLGEKTEADGLVWWSTSFLVLDFDGSRPTELVSFINTLAGLGILTYATTGTTGRGAHLYIFLSLLLSQKRAHAAVKHLQAVAHDVGLGLPEIRPSSWLGNGSPIFLPYRAAGEDGFGVNPLLDPENDLRPVNLGDAHERVRRVAPNVLEAACRELGGKAAGPVQRDTSSKKIHKGNLRQKASISDPLAAELERLAEMFVEPHRQNIIMGVTAYGVRGLGLSGPAVREAVEKFIQQNDRKDYKRRLEAVNYTIKKYARGGLVAWHEFYQRAGVEVPHRVGVSDEVLAQLELAQQLVAYPAAWPGRKGASERSLVQAFVEVLGVHGKLHDDGVATSISQRNLAENARVGTATCQKALRRLRERGLMRPDKSKKRKAEDADVLVLLKEGVHKLLHSFSTKGGLNEWDSLYTHPAFMHGKLGKSTAALLIALLAAETPLTRPELAKRVGRESRAIRRLLEKLLEHEVILGKDGAYQVMTDWEGALERAAQVTGAYRSLVRQEERHVTEREMFHTMLAMTRSARRSN